MATGALLDAESGEPPVVHAVGLVKEFLGGDGGVIRILDEVSITVKRGEMVAVVMRPLPNSGTVPLGLCFNFIIYCGSSRRSRT